jgi:hypothetical protein
VAAALHCITGARLLRLEAALRAAGKLSEDDDTIAMLADLTIKVLRRLRAHEEQCSTCLFWEHACRRQ